MLFFAKLRARPYLHHQIHHWYNDIYSYGQSKLANILHANQLSSILKEQEANVSTNSLHPGAIVTNILRHHSIVNGVVTTLGKYVMKNVQHLELQRSRQEGTS
ncbi:hypothetical protein J5N97_024282 [Dioscorea zingiberensis]|uniref:Uncharacterized protein n=1 Tax=Dioscorea zingiberensis TaxID=325984 RepID=A0A9D5H8P0_9LILI|nr:hypothetical protein J5N97_024282 [Dioscorea zingiberensis]